MESARITRRRSPGWVRRLSSRQLHGLAGKFVRDQQAADLTERQEWLFESVISELEYRHRRCHSVWDRCACAWCVPPFLEIPPQEARRE
jgi:hypothetical protein